MNLNHTKNQLQMTISNICNNQYKYFLNKANVIGLGCGYKIKNGFHTNKLCIQVFVVKKFIKTHLLYNDIVPSVFKGIPTDVIETSRFTSCSLNKKIRPVLGGYSISVYNDAQYSGTAGCLVTNDVLNFVLSTNHSIAKLNVSPIGTSIIQPAHQYGGYAPQDTIAKLHRFIPLRFIEGGSQPVNLSDCAIAALTNPNILSPKIAFIGNLQSVKNPHINAPVKKVGAATELTTGIIISTNSTITVRYSTGDQCLFRNQIFTTKMSQKGDSGAILVDNNYCALGILVSNNDNISHFSPLNIVLDQLDVKLVT